jgi:hypothetical protein
MVVSSFALCQVGDVVAFGKSEKCGTLILERYGGLIIGT